MSYRVVVDLKSLVVKHGGDSSSRTGNIGFEVLINNVVVAHRWGSEIANVVDGTVIWIGTRHETRVSDPNTAGSFYDNTHILWHVWDVDKFSDDDAGWVNDFYSFYDLRAGPKSINKNLTGDGMNVEVSYTIRLVEVPNAIDTTNGLEGIVLYENKDFNSGTPIGNVMALLPSSQTFGLGMHNLPKPNGAGDMLFSPVRPERVSSLRVGTGFKVTLYDDINLNGQSVEIVKDTRSMPAAWDNRTKSILVSRFTY